uniref:Uncharacterized protein n=2 Tax=Chrysotila carterae TaxID=13221 RepID=A0A7S4BH68_CHRCT
MASLQPEAVVECGVDGRAYDDEAAVEQTEWMGPMLHALEMQEAYGDGLSALLQHLAASRQPSVQAWMQLKLEAERSNELSSSTWTNLASLEEDFVLMNHEHIHSSSLTSWAAPAVRSAVH